MTSPESTDSMEELGKASDTIDNLLGAMQLPLPAQLHLDQLRRSLPEIRDTMRRVYVERTGDNPWDTHDLS